MEYQPGFGSFKIMLTCFWGAVNEPLLRRMNSAGAHLVPSPRFLTEAAPSQII